MMITGDHHYTAIAVATDVGIVRPQRQVVIIDTDHQSQLHSELSSIVSPFETATRVASSNFSRQSSMARLPSHRAVLWGDGQAPCHRPTLDQQHQVDPGGDGHSIDAGVEQAKSEHPSLSRLLAAQPTAVPASQTVEQQAAANWSLGSAPASPHDHGALPPMSCAPKTSWEGLRFETDGHEPVDAQQAITGLAEGQMQCAVTGDAFEHLLQHSNLSLLDMVMRNAVVFSRMQPFQKGQVMDLLSVRGMHQLFNGQTRFIPVLPLPLALQLGVLHICA